VKPYLRDGDVTLYLGDALEVLAEIPARSVHAIVTDPPYGIAFMGAEWDRRSAKAFSAWCEEWGAAVQRVALPGAFVLAFGSPRTFHRLAVGLEDSGLELRDTLAWLHGQGKPPSRVLAEGVETALKPAWEPVLVFRTPLEERTATAQHAATRTGGLQVGACRLGTEVIPTNGWRSPDGAGVLAKHGGLKWQEHREQTLHVGRHPANVALDEEAAAQLDAEAAGGRGNGRGAYVQPRESGPSTFSHRGHVPFHYGDAGGPSRFYFTAKASPNERDGSDHPTVKPRSLMRWLVRLVTPPGGVVLDPFAGSGTTLLAARDEHLRAIGIEREPAHAADAAHRLRQLSLFGLEQGETPAHAGQQEGNG
jgi:DNA modification methylase